MLFLGGEWNSSEYEWGEITAIKFFDMGRNRFDGVCESLVAGAV